MQITIFSFLSSVLWSSVLIAFSYAIRKINVLNQLFGISLVICIYLFCVVRMLFPTEFIFSRAIEVNAIYPTLYSHLFVFHTDFVVPIKPIQILLILWGTVSVVLLIRLGVSYHKTVRSIAQNKKPCKSKEEEILKIIIQQSERKIRVSLSATADISVPMEIGIFHKMILLPEKVYTDRDIYYILLHEYTHILNRDTIVKMLVWIFGCIFWWNPFAYLLKRDLEQTQEIKCDLTVVKKMNLTQRTDYLSTIVRALKEAKTNKKYLYASSALIIQNRASDIKERFQSVAAYTFHKRSKWFKGACYCALLLLAVTSYSFVVQPVFEAPSSTETNAIDYTPSDAHVVQTNDGIYLLYIKNHGSRIIQKDYADLLKNIGFTIVRE